MYFIVRFKDSFIETGHTEITEFGECEHYESFDECFSNFYKLLNVPISFDDFKTKEIPLMNLDNCTNVYTDGNFYSIAMFSDKYDASSYKFHKQLSEFIKEKIRNNKIDKLCKD